MLRLSLFFFVIAIVSGVFGFTGIAAASSDIARFLFFLFVAGFVITLALGIFAGAKLKQAVTGSGPERLNP